MNPITDTIFIVTWIALLIWAISSIVKGFKSREVRDYTGGTWTTEVTKRVHPEMQDVEPGEQLLGVTFEQKTECDLEEYRDLQNRIEELRQELEDPWEDDDDDGGAVVRR
tara:strand:+ start:299 stop:628 length:330 start_codon:yes stop_codon:yes gene_type:complete